MGEESDGRESAKSSETHWGELRDLPRGRENQSCCVEQTFDPSAWETEAGTSL